MVIVVITEIVYGHLFNRNSLWLPIQWYIFYWTLRFSFNTENHFRLLDKTYNHKLANYLFPLNNNCTEKTNWNIKIPKQPKNFYTSINKNSITNATRCFQTECNKQLKKEYKIDPIYQERGIRMKPSTSFDFYLLTCYYSLSCDKPDETYIICILIFLFYVL